MSIIEIKDLHKTYHSKGRTPLKAVDSVNLSIKEGEIFGIIGFSGAGKSTLIRCINRLEEPDSGSIFIEKEDILIFSQKRLREARQGIGMIFQHFNLLNSRTVYDNIAFPLEVAGKNRDEITARVQELLGLVGLEDKGDAYPAQLSGGQKQRVGIARALANHPKILLCDEATSALDPQTTKSILALLLEIKRKLNLTIVLITHEMTVITEICDKVAVMEDGKVVEQGTVKDIFTHPKHETTKGFVEVVVNKGLPEVYSNYQPDGCLIRLFFTGDSAKRPFISRLLKEFDVDANILHGQIDHIKDSIYGLLIIDLSGAEEERIKAIEFLKEQGINVEILR